VFGTASLILLPMGLHIAAVQLPLLGLASGSLWTILIGIIGIPGTLGLITLLLYCHCCDPGIIPRRKKVTHFFFSPPLTCCCGSVYVMAYHGLP